MARRSVAHAQELDQTRGARARSAPLRGRGADLARAARVFERSYCDIRVGSGYVPEKEYPTVSINAILVTILLRCSFYNLIVKKLLRVSLYSN